MLPGRNRIFRRREGSDALSLRGKKHTPGEERRAAGDLRARSRYPAGILQRSGLWGWCAFLALFCTMVTYPGIWYSDSYVRVTTAYAVMNSVKITLAGHPAPLYTGNAFTVIPSFMMGLSLLATGHVALYTFCQAFGFFAAVFLLIRELDPPFPKAVCVLFAVSPVIYGASVYYEANVGSLIGLILLILLFRRCGEEPRPAGRVLEFILIALSSLITFGYRTNALTVLPVLIFCLFRSARRRRAKKLPALCALLFGIALTWLIPRAFQVIGESNAGTGLVWEILTTIQRMDEPSQAAYLDYLDDIGGEGATLAALRSSTEDSVDNFMWGTPLNPETLSAPGAFSRVVGKYLRLILEKPGDWLRVKADFVAKALGLPAPLDLYEYPYNRWDRMEAYGMTDSRQRTLFHASVIRENELLQFFTCRPWIAFLISGALLLIETLRGSKKRALYALLFWLAVFYYLAYLIMIVVFQQRMFYPSLLLLLSLDACVTSEWISALISAVRSVIPERRSRHASRG